MFSLMYFVYLAPCLLWMKSATFHGMLLKMQNTCHFSHARLMRYGTVIPHITCTLSELQVNLSGREVLKFLGSFAVEFQVCYIVFLVHSNKFLEAVTIFR
jgi:hypothetical protein